MRLSILIAMMLMFAPPAARAESPRPGISIVSARKIALARVPGTILNEKHKDKAKGHPALWSIKIRPKGSSDADHVTKVEVDATTGVILKVKEVKARKAAD